MEPTKYERQDEEKICIITRSDGKMVTLRGPQSVINGTVRQSKPELHIILYRLAQQAAWVALGTHLLVLGMCTLVTQIYTVILLVSCTVAVSFTTDWSADTQHKITMHGLLNTTTTKPFSDYWDVIKTDPATRTMGSHGSLEYSD